MGLLRPLRTLYIRTTDLSRGLQGRQDKLARFYRLWSICYDVSVALDPAFRREMGRMVSATVRPDDVTLDIGCGTGISTFMAAGIARRVTGLDPSTDMLAKLEAKMRRTGTTNIETITGTFPEAMPQGALFDSIISSFTIVHFPPERRAALYRDIFSFLKPGGRLGLFAAQGEIAASFETRDEQLGNMASAGFVDVRISDVADIYRIVLAGREQGDLSGAQIRSIT